MLKVCQISISCISFPLFLHTFAVQNIFTLSLNIGNGYKKQQLMHPLILIRKYIPTNHGFTWKTFFCPNSRLFEFFRWQQWMITLFDLQLRQKEPRYSTYLVSLNQIFNQFFIYPVCRGVDDLKIWDFCIFLVLGVLLEMFHWFDRDFRRFLFLRIFEDIFYVSIFWI